MYCMHMHLMDEMQKRKTNNNNNSNKKNKDRSGPIKKKEHGGEDTEIVCLNDVITCS